MPSPQYLLEGLLHVLRPSSWLRQIGFTPFEWQEGVFNSEATRIIVNGARQVGKSTIVSGKPAHVAKYEPRSLSVILAATERQAVEDMEKVKEYMAMDPDYPKILRDSDSQIELENGSRVLVLPATEKGARGFSSPRLIILDEASRIDDPVYQSGVRAMLTDNPTAQLIDISTPNGRKGHFARAWRNPRWERWEIYAPWQIKNGRLHHHLRPALERGVEGVKRFASPRHGNLDEMEEHLGEMGELMFRQEYLVEFVEPEDQVFSYDEIEDIFRAGAPNKLLGDSAPESALVRPLFGA